MQTQKDIRADFKNLSHHVIDLKKELNIDASKGVKRNYNGVVIYDGPSLIDGAPIVAIATGLIIPSQNRKTGDMVQVWIMRSDVPPLFAFQTDKDCSVCGDCRLRKDAEGHRICYVELHKGLTNIWRSWEKGQYPRLFEYPEAASIMSVKPVRLGAYGEPTAIPYEVMKPLVLNIPVMTGYTHQWQKPFALPWRGILQASCDTRDEARKAVDAGWHYYRVIADKDDVQENEFLCPAQSGPVQCATCGLCSGKAANITAIVHGLGKRFFKRMFCEEKRSESS